MPNNENVNRTKADERIRRAFSKMSHMLGSILNGLKHKSSYYAATYFCITKIIMDMSCSELSNVWVNKTETNRSSVSLRCYIIAIDNIHIWATTEK